MLAGHEISDVVNRLLGDGGVEMDCGVGSG